MSNQNNQEEEEKPGSHSLELGVMSKGDYMIHIFIESGKNFVLPADDAKNTFNAILQLQVGDNKLYSKTLKDVVPKSDSMRYWGEHFFFEPKNMSSDDIQSSVLTIKILDKGFLRDSMIGMFDIDVSQVYFTSNEHAIFNQWVALNNPDAQDKSEIKGYLQVSIAVQGPGDNAVKLSESTSLEDPSKVNVLMPASIRKDYKQLTISVIEAHNLPKMDTFGTIDAYVKTTFNKQEYKTKVVNPKKEGADQVCYWKEQFKIPLQWPISNDKFTLAVWDYESATSDEICGTMAFSLKELVKNCSTPNGIYRWCNIYGAPTASVIQGPWQNRMNKHPEVASVWKGRCLFNIKVHDAKTPDKGVFQMPESIMQTQEYKQAHQMQKFQVQFEIGSGVCLPGNTNYRVRLQMGKFIIDSNKPQAYNNEYCRWNQRNEKKGFETLCQSIEEIDRVYIYLMDDTTPVCYWRGKASDFLNRNPEFKWVALTNDLAVGKVKDPYKAGMIQIKLTINPLKNNPQINFEQFPNWNVPIPKRTSQYTLRCFIFQCRDLPSADEEGSSDVYIEIWNQKNQKVQTKTIYDNLNPIFYEALEIKMDVNDLQSAPPIIFKLWDKDEDVLNLDDDDFLGFATIPITEANIVIRSADIDKDRRIFKNKKNMTFSNDPEELNQIPDPKWHDVKNGLKEELAACGQVLCSFVLVEDANQFNFKQTLEQTSLAQKVQTKSYDVEINVLSLRDLQSFGILPIKKPFIQFNIRSLLPPDRADAVTNIKTAPKATGKNPVINQTISFTSMLPTEKLYCPKLACEVFDYICKGLSQPIVGSFVIDIGQIMNDLIEHRRGELRTSETCIKQIKEKVDALPEFTGVINEEESVASSQMNYARSIGYEMGDIVADFKGQLNAKTGKHKKKKKKGKGISKNQEEQKLLRSIQEVSDLEENRKTEDDFDLATETYIGQENDKTIMIREEDYGDEETSLLQENDQIDSRQIRRDQSSLLVGQKTDLAAKDLNKMVKLCMRDKKDEQKKVMIKSLTEHFKKAVAQQPGSLKALNEKIDGLQSLRTNNDNTDEEDDEDKTVSKIKAGILKQVLEAKQQQKDDEKKRNFIKKKTDGLKMIQAGIQIHKNLLFPQYQMDERLKVYREVNIPSNSLYMAVGYDGAVTDHAPTLQNRHYRKFYMDELENNQEIFKKSIFCNSQIMRGQSRGLKKGLFEGFANMFQAEDQSEEKSSLKQVGMFKGYVNIFNKENYKLYKKTRKKNIQEIFELLDQLHVKKCGKKFKFNQQSLTSLENKSKLRQHLHEMDIYTEQLYEFLLHSSFEDQLLLALQTPTPCLVRVYILEAFDLASRDIGSDSDPFLILKCGKEIYNGQDDYQLDEPNPLIYKSFEITSTFPGAPPLEIEFWDYDDLFGDDLIGKTIVDLDERQFSMGWRQIQHKPIEYRELYHQSSSMSQGSVICWIDIEESGKKKNATQMWDITPEPTKDYQLRVSVYDAKNVPREDVEGTSDVFVKVFYGTSQDPKETDTHWRCTTGTASFNYRLLFDFKAPAKKSSQANTLRLQLFDRDIFKSNDFLCEFTLDLELLIKDCRLTQKPMHLNKKYYNSFFKDAYTKQKSTPAPQITFEDDDSFWLHVKREADTKPIKIRLDIRCLPGLDASNQKVGIARALPNHSPELPEPYGRFKFSLNPFDMIGRLCGPEIKMKIMGYCGTIVCVVLCFMCLPMIFSDVVSKLFLKLFGLG